MSDGRTEGHRQTDGPTDGRPAFLCPTQTSFAEDNKPTENGWECCVTLFDFLRIDLTVNIASIRNEGQPSHSNTVSVN